MLDFRAVMLTAIGHAVSAPVLPSRKWINGNGFILINVPG